MDKLTTINFNGVIECNVYGDKDNPLIDPKPVADFLGFRKVADMCRYLPDKYKIVVEGVKLTPSGNLESKRLFITEKGLYRVLLRSNNPNAEPFQEYVEDVLTDIRKTGGMGVVKQSQARAYELCSTDEQIQAVDKLIDSYDMELKENRRLARQQALDKIKLEAENKQLRIEKQTIYDDCCGEPCSTVNEIIKELDHPYNEALRAVGAYRKTSKKYLSNNFKNSCFALLRKHGYLYKDAEQTTIKGGKYLEYKNVNSDPNETLCFKPGMRSIVKKILEECLDRYLNSDEE